MAEKLVDEVFLRFSPPEQLHSDQGRQFESALIAEICKLLQIRKTHTTPYHPQCDGLVEHFNRTLLSMLATCAEGHPFDWEQQLRKVCMAYNTSVQSSTGFTPFYLMFGRQASRYHIWHWCTRRREQGCQYLCIFTKEEDVRSI